MTPRQTLDNVFPPPMAPSDNTSRTQMSRSRSLKSRESSLAPSDSFSATNNSEGQGPARSMTLSRVSSISTIESFSSGSPLLRFSSFSSSTLEGHPSPALSTTATLSAASTVSDLATIHGSPPMGSLSSASFAVEAAPYNLGSSGDKLHPSTIQTLQTLGTTNEPDSEPTRYTALKDPEQEIIRFTPYSYNFLRQYNTDEPTSWSRPPQANQPQPLPWFDFRTATLDDILEEKNLFADFLLGQLFPLDLGVHSFPMFEEVWPITRVIYNLNFENRKLGFNWWLWDREETYAARKETSDADGKADEGMVQLRKWIGTMLFLHGEDLGEAYRFQ